MLLLYVDDLFVTGMDGLIADTKRKLAAEFNMKDLGMMHYFLGMEVWESVDEIFLGQGKYAVEILKRFGMMDCKDRPPMVRCKFRAFLTWWQAGPSMVRCKCRSFLTWW